MSEESIDLPDFEKAGGLLPAIAQDASTGQVLMLAWMNRESFEQTIATRQAVYYSRSRQCLWLKGATSGHVQHVESMHIDCDADAILLKVRQTGAACHKGYFSCFFRRYDGLRWAIDDPPVVTIKPPSRK